MPQAVKHLDLARWTLVVLGDSCSGQPGTRHADNLAELSRVVLSDPRKADALIFLGDHIAGYSSDPRELNAQWDHFLEHEFRDLRGKCPVSLHIAGNHDAFSPASAEICQSRMPIPATTRHRAGLNYVCDLGGVEIFCLATVNLADQGTATVDMDWLREGLGSSDAPLRIVAGHYPVHPINGYDEAPTWCFNKPQAEELWALFSEFDVLAYLCSHIIAFDFQVHDDIVQLCSGGAGTVFGPGGAMGDGEYRHYVFCEIGPDRFRFEAIDASGAPRERGEYIYRA